MLALVLLRRFRGGNGQGRRNTRSLLRRFRHWDPPFGKRRPAAAPPKPRLGLEPAGQDLRALRAPGINGQYRSDRRRLPVLSVWLLALNADVWSHFKLVRHKPGSQNEPRAEHE